ncbi:MAG: phosphoenolpyruvate synthase, partial [Halobacteriota archaeon]|nr:phosphoenolpyruvate synthase [Halobacteriota archaeon]
MSDEMSIVWLEDVNAKDVKLVGGKGASLGEMINASLPVPGGFAVTATAFRRFLDETGIAHKLFKVLDVNVDNDKELKKSEKLAKDLILTTEIPEYMNNDITEAYKELCKREGKDVFVAVRSSATAEDLPDASFAGQQETFLNIKGEADLLEAVKKCWASLYGARAIFYRSKQGFDHDSVNISVIVQIMINAEKAGVMFTSHPSTGAAEAVIEAAWGLGESVVSGSVSPDNYVVDTATGKVKSKMIAKKEVMHITNSNGSVSNEDVPDDMKDSQVMTDEEIIKLAKMGKIIEEHYGSPQDVEWTLNNGNLNIVQSRPITTISEVPKEGATEVSTKEIILEGLGASPGIGSGRVTIVYDPSELSKVEEGDILVTKMTTPDMVPAMKRAAGIVTDEGGLTCHAAIVSRELGTPAVVGTKEATKKLKDGDEITIDGERGLVYEGILDIKPSKKAHAQQTDGQKIITATEVKVNIDFPEIADKAAETGADGVGLLRVEHMIISLGKHPSLFIKEGKSDEYVEALFNDI